MIGPCKSCKYWRPDQFQTQWSLDRNGKTGGCIRHAPVAMQTLAGQPMETTWPTTSEDQSCGEFEQAE